MTPAHDVWHEGERALHRSLGVEEKMQTRGQIVVRGYMPDQHREFFEKLRFLVLSAVDKDGRVWPFMRFGGVGFIQSPDSTTLVVSSQPLPSEPDGLDLNEGAKISVLGIELETKRRNRMNGTISYRDHQQLHISVDQSFGNCPRYIHVRKRVKSASSLAEKLSQSKKFNAADFNKMRRADMLFIASRAPELTQDRRAGVDVNHRGGLPGFVRVLDDQTLIIPDYDGNKFFNTFGNIMRDPRCGIQFPDFQTGDLLTLNGHAEVIADDPTGMATYGSNRYLKFKAEILRRAVGAFALCYHLQDVSDNPPEPPRIKP
ncbi:MAG: pyridoxamine 5'-phosphate oxidase family protein [Paracoccaceae bacterium]